MIILYIKKFIGGKNLVYFRELNDKKNQWGMLLFIQLHPTLCDPMDYSMPTLPVPHHLLEFAQVLIHCTSDAIQLSHPLTPPSPSALNLSQHQGLFQ